MIFSLNSLVYAILYATVPASMIRNKGCMFDVFLGYITDSASVKHLQLLFFEVEYPPPDFVLMR